jgi:hypothetical protein
VCSSDLARTSPNTIRMGITRLVEIGYIVVEERRDEKGDRLSNIYRLLGRPPSNLKGGGTDFEVPSFKNDRVTITTEVEPSKKHIPPSADFDSWYQGYPKRLGKKAALKCFLTRRKEGVTLEELTTSRDNYAAHLAAEKTEAKFIMHPSTFLSSNERWKDYLKPIPKAAVPQRPGVVEFKGRKCPKCGKVQMHSAGMCLDCGEEMPRRGA